MRFPVIVSLGSLAIGLASAAQGQTAASAAPTVQNNQEIVVTGNASGAKVQPSVAVSVMKAQQLQQMAPISAADVLKAVPGVFVNSVLGETRNIVYSRGVSANSTDGNGGYYYVSMQEDGMPVTNITASNYGPDLFYRQDLSLSRLEALRGGTAVVTGPNAPGGIFNYISRTGKTDPGLEISGRVGLEGNGRNPYYRIDAYAGGQTGIDNLYYTLSGFYRWDKGSRDPGYAFDRGGQVKGNLVYDDGSTKIQLNGKYLDDRNLFYEFSPAFNYKDPKVAPGLSRYDSYIIGANPHSSVPWLGGPERSWDASQLPHYKSYVISLDARHDFGGGFEIENNFKYDHNNAHYQTGSTQYAVPLNDPTLAQYLNITRVGTYNITNQQGQLMARIVRSAPGTAASAAKITVNNLPNQQVLANGILGQQAYDTTFDAHEIMDQFSATKHFDTMSFKVGAFFAQSKLDRLLGAAGVGIAGIGNQPELYNITLTTPAGVVQQVTQAGFASIGNKGGGTQTTDKQTQISLFAGHNWQITDRLSTDLGLRYEHMQMKGVNTPESANPNGSNPAYGGLDGDPNTLYDNFVNVLGTPVPYNYKLHYIGLSGAVTYKFNSHNSVFVRYSQGKKAPDIFFYATINSASARDALHPIPQKVMQIEGGYRHDEHNFWVSVNPFYSKLSNVYTVQTFIDQNGLAYSPTPLFSTNETLGVEIEGDLNFLHYFNLHTAVTVQDPKSKNFAIWVQNQAGPQDDTISAVPNGLADNNPKYMATTTLRFTPSEHFTVFTTWKYLGARAANRYNTFFLPAFSQFDLGATYTFNEHFDVSFNVNNVFNEAGVMSFSPAGSFTNALDRQSFTPAQRAANPNGLFSILTSQPRAFFLTGKVKF